MSRQTKRQASRIQAKLASAAARKKERAAAKRKLLERQTKREKDGLYTGRSVALSIAPSRSRANERRVQKGKAYGRILRTEIIGSREVSFHATKGWRSHRA